MYYSPPYGWPGGGAGGCWGHAPGGTEKFGGGGGKGRLGKPALPTICDGGGGGGGGQGPVQFGGGRIGAPPNCAGSFNGRPCGGAGGGFRGRLLD